MTNLYDRVHYPGSPYLHTHPASLGVFAALAGLPFAPFERCRMLEIGCGDGVNLIAMAIGAPEARFVGVDLAEAPIRQARSDAAACGLANAEFHAIDLRNLDATFGEFDYIVAHGVLAWVPDFVREALFRVIGDRLRPGGLAMVSYNTLPAARFRQALRDMLLFETREADTPEAKLRIAYAFLERMAADWSETESDERTLSGEARRILGHAPSILFHDEMGDVFAPQLISDVAALAQAHGLNYLADARAQPNMALAVPSEEQAALLASVGGDVVRFEQQIDFLRLRRFRNSIFVKGQGAALRAGPERLAGLWACCELRRGAPDPAAPELAAFEMGEKIRLTTNDPRLAALLTRFADAFPLALPLDEAAGDPALAEHVFRLFFNEVARVTTAPLARVGAAGPRPIASPLARLQAARGETEVVVALHRLLHVAYDKVSSLIPLLDGTRDRSQLAADWAAAAGFSEAETLAELDGTLPQLARAALFVG